MNSMKTDTIRDAAETTKKAVVQKAEKAADKVSDQADNASSFVSTYAEKGMEMAKDQLEVMKDQVDSLREQTNEFVKAAEKSIRKNPLPAVAVAAGVGMVLAGLAVRAVSRA